MANAWLEHVKQWRAQHGEGMKYKDVLIEARKSYTPVTNSVTKAPKATKAKKTKKIVRRLPREDITKILTP